LDYARGERTGDRLRAQNLVVSEKGQWRHHGQVNFVA